MYPRIAEKLCAALVEKMLAAGWIDEADAALLKRLGVGLRDMEGAAMAHVCETAGARFVSIKCVSDVYGSGSMPGQYLENLKKCLGKLAEIVPRLY